MHEIKFEREIKSIEEISKIIIYFKNHLKIYSRDLKYFFFIKECICLYPLYDTSEIFIIPFLQTAVSITVKKEAFALLSEGIKMMFLHILYT